MAEAPGCQWSQCSSWGAPAQQPAVRVRRNPSAFDSTSIKPRSLQVRRSKEWSCSPTRRPTDMVHNCPIDEWLQVGLIGKTFHYQPVHSAVGCGPAAGIRMNPGVSRFPITVATSDQSCQPPGSATRTTSSMGCDEPAPLGAGTYRTQVFIASFRPLFSPAMSLLVHIRSS